MSVSIINNIFLNSISADSLVTDSSVVTGNAISFLQTDTIGSFSQGMPIHEISEIDSLFLITGNWFALSILGLIIYLLIVRFLYSFNISETMKGFGKIQSLDLVSFEKESQLTGYVLSPLAVFVYAFYLYFFINPLYFHLISDFLFLIFALGIILLFLIKTLIEKTISIVFKTQNTFKQYFSDHLLVLGLSSLIQVPLIVIYFYSKLDVFIWISLTVLVLLWVFRLLRGFIIGIKQTTFSKSFIILYLCSLEILPLIIALKLAIR